MIATRRIRMRAWCMEGYFFFSSRRRHTRLQGDWSSDVCSSDLDVEPDLEPVRTARDAPADVLRDTHVGPIYHRQEDGVALGVRTAAQGEVRILVDEGLPRRGLLCGGVNGDRKSVV